MADITGYSTPGELVKRFSWDIENRDSSDAETEEFSQLRRDLLEHSRVSTSDSDEEIRRLESYFSETRWDKIYHPRREDLECDEESFRKARRELIDCMQSFQSLIPEELRTTVIPRSWSDVDAAVSSVQKHWECQSQGNKTSQAKAWFRKMCNGLHNHKALLDLLPKESEYVSVIAGAVTMIIKASANYTKISESFTTGVIAINDAVALVQGNQAYNTPRLQELSMRLYTGVFGYLSKFMTWFRSKSVTRLMWSLNENLAQTFADDIQQVKSTSILISQQIQLYMSIDVRVSKLQGRDTNWGLKHLIALVENAEAQRRIQVAASQRQFERILSTRAQMSDEDLERIAAKIMSGFKEDIRQKISGQAISNILERQASTEIDSRRALSRKPETRVTDDVWDSTSTGENPLSTPRRDQDIKLWSAHLEDYYNSEQIYPFPDTPQEFYAETAFVSRLGEFTTVLESQVLYAMTRFQPLGHNLLRLSAAKYAGLARANDVLVVSFFCLPLSDDTNQHIALLYALIRQVVELLDDSTLASEQVTEERIKTLEGTVDTWETALQLFNEMVRNIRVRQLLFVIDGINLVEDDSDDATEERVRGVVRALKGLACPNAVRNCIVKVLFTTAGRSSCLCDELDSDQMVVCDVSSPVGTGPRKSRRFLLY